MLSTKDQTVRPIGTSICPYVVASRPMCSLESWCPQPYSKKCMLLSHPDFTSWGIPPTKTFRTCAGRACAPTSGIALQASITKQENTVWSMMSHWCHWKSIRECPIEMMPWKRLAPHHFGELSTCQPWSRCCCHNVADWPIASHCYISPVQ